MEETSLSLCAHRAIGSEASEETARDDGNFDVFFFANCNICGTSLGLQYAVANANGELIP